MNKKHQMTIRYYSNKDIDTLPQLQRLSPRERFEMKVVANVFPFRVNNYVIENLIDWDKIPDDPIYRLTFMHRDMLEDYHFDKMANALNSNLSPAQIKKTANEIRLELNPHPAGQLSANVPVMDDSTVKGVQHKYKETALIFPSGGQTCHSYCTFCFRWPQFTGMSDLKFATDESNRFQEYIKRHKEITNILITGGDPMVMKISKLEKYILPFLEPELEHLRAIRIGTKSLGYWPYRFVGDKDADDILKLFAKVKESGKHLSIMAHFNHPVELTTNVVKTAIRRILDTGASIRTQSPIIKHINDSAAIWEKMWREQVRLGCIPYYMFVERDTGAHNYFAIPLAKAQDIFRKAFTKVSGLARTVRGPSMSALPGKVLVEGVTTINREKVFMLSLIQARNPEWAKKPFFAKFDPHATWLTHLKPAFEDKRFFYENELEMMLNQKNMIEKQNDRSNVNSYTNALWIN